MRITTSATLVTYDMGQKLQFAVTRESDWFRRSVGVAVICWFAYETYKSQSWWLFICVVAGAVGLIAILLTGIRPNSM